MMFGWLRGQGGWENISAGELQRRMAGESQPVVIDVREPYEFKQGHIPGAKLIPLGSLQAQAGKLDRTKQHVLVCLSGARSRQGCALLAQSGLENLANLSGGMGAWTGKITR